MEQIEVVNVRQRERNATSGEKIRGNEGKGGKSRKKIGIGDREDERIGRETMERKN